MAIAGAVVLLITLIALGGYFLYQSLPGNGDAVVPDETGTSADARADATDMKVLYIRVIGESSDVIVRVPGGEVLTDTTMQQGQHVAYDQPNLDVTISDPGEVEVYVNGEVKDISGEESDFSFTVEEG